jgi:hypothetical protein
MLPKAALEIYLVRKSRRLLIINKQLLLGNWSEQSMSIRNDVSKALKKTPRHPKGRWSREARNCVDMRAANQATEPERHVSRFLISVQKWIDQMLFENWSKTGVPSTGICTFGRIGLIFTANGTRPDPARIDNLVKFSAPKNTSDVVFGCG